MNLQKKPTETNIRRETASEWGRLRDDELEGASKRRRARKKEREREGDRVKRKAANREIDLKRRSKQVCFILAKLFLVRVLRSVGRRVFGIFCGCAYVCVFSWFNVVLLRCFFLFDVDSWSNFFPPVCMCLCEFYFFIWFALYFKCSIYGNCKVGS